MGFIADLTGGTPAPTKRFPGQDVSSSLWREVFKVTSKEDGSKENESYRSPTPGGGWGRSVISSDAAVKRLLQAMRSMAPGGWSDDRWEATRHFKGIQYVCIHRTGEMMSQADFQVYERDDKHPDGKRPVTRGHPGYRLVELLEKPNNQDGFGDWMYRINQQMDLTGSGLTWMVPNRLQVPMELYCIPTSIAIPQPAVNPDFPDGFYRIQPVYPYGPFSSYPTPASAVGAPIGAQWMMKMQYPHPLLRYDGFSPMTALDLHLDEVEAIDRSRWYSMKREFNPSAVLQFKGEEGMQPLPQPELDRIRAEFENSFLGPENTGQLFVASPGAELKPWGTSPIDMDFYKGWEQLVSFCMAGFGITKPAAGMVDDSSYSVLFATLKQFHLLTLEPKCSRISRCLTRHLAPFFGDNLIIEIRCKRIDDHDITFAKLRLGMEARAITKNDVLRELGFPVTREPWGNEMAGTEPAQPGAAPGAGGAAGGAGGAMAGLGALLGATPGNGQPAPPQQPANSPSPKGDFNGTEPPEVFSTRPRTGADGHGGLGPRGNLARTNGRPRL